MLVCSLLFLLLFSIFFEVGSHCVAQVGPKLPVLLASLPNAGIMDTHCLTSTYSSVFPRVERTGLKGPVLVENSGFSLTLPGEGKEGGCCHLGRNYLFLNCPSSFYQGNLIFSPREKSQQRNRLRWSPSWRRHCPMLQMLKCVTLQVGSWEVEEGGG